MKTKMKKILDAIDKATTTGLCILLALSVAIIGYQVFMRYVLNTSPHWSEELARFCNVGITMFGAALAVRSGSHITLDFIDSVISEKTSLILDVINSFGCLLFFGLLTYSSYIYFVQAGNQMSAGLEIPMYIPYGGVVVSAVFGILYSLELAIKSIGILTGNYNKLEGAK